MGIEQAVRDFLAQFCQRFGYGAVALIGGNASPEWWE
jgi:hypothetical protein